jgi:hypothetical protein
MGGRDTICAMRCMRALARERLSNNEELFKQVRRARGDTSDHGGPDLRPVNNE